MLTDERVDKIKTTPSELQKIGQLFSRVVCTNQGGVRYFFVSDLNTFDSYAMKIYVFLPSELIRASCTGEVIRMFSK